MLCQLRLNICSRTAILAVNGCFNDYPASVLIRGLGDLKTYVTVIAVNAHLLEKGHCNMEHLELDPGSGRVERTGRFGARYTWYRL